MKRALQGILIAGEEMRDATLAGRKCITIREGHRDYTLGPVLLGCHILNWATMGEIIEVRHTILERVSRDELKDDGFLNWTDAILGLKKFYPNIDLDSDVTVIRWKKIIAHS